VAFDAVIVAGGAGSRMRPPATGSDPADKAILDVGGVTLLDRVLAAVAAAEQIVIVGPRRPVSKPDGVTVTFTTEQPPGSGPAAALVHALTFVTAPLVVVLAADVPFAATAVPRLIEAITTRTDVGAAMIVDQAGRRQSLLAIYRSEALRRAADSDRWIGRSMHELTTALSVLEVAAIGVETLDCDTPEQLATARALAQPVAQARSMSPPAG
jgi:molybdopterin-guanine dinucleotide biosynthesis protein A